MSFFKRMQLIVHLGVWVLVHCTMVQFAIIRWVLAPTTVGRQPWQYAEAMPYPLALRTLADWQSLTTI